MKKKISRMRRSANTKLKFKKMGIIKLVVHRTSKHMYAQIVNTNNGKILAYASTVEKSIKNKIQYSGNKFAASIIGKIIAERAKNKKIENISFDRSGFKYHGRVKELANSARKFGLQF